MEARFTADSFLRNLHFMSFFTLSLARHNLVQKGLLVLQLQFRAEGTVVGRYPG